MYHLITEEYHGSQISFREEDAWVNLTEMCAAFNKRPGKFLELPATKEYMDALIADQGLLSDNRITKVVETDKARGRAGTWVHPDLGIECARWLSPELSIRCNRIIRRLLAGETIRGNSQSPVLRQLGKQRLKLRATELQAEIVAVRRQLANLIASEELPGHVTLAEWLGATGHGLTWAERAQLGTRLARQARQGEITSGTKNVPDKASGRMRRFVTYQPEAIAAVHAVLCPPQLSLVTGPCPLTPAT